MYATLGVVRVISSRDDLLTINGSSHKASHGTYSNGDLCSAPGTLQLLSPISVTDTIHGL
jgi:hypothetical protein